MPITVNRVLVDDYSGKIHLKNTLTIEDSPSTKVLSEFVLSAAPGGEIRGFSNGVTINHSSINISPESTFWWKQGTLRNLTVHISRSATGVPAKADIGTWTVASTGTRTMHGSAFDVYGDMTWYGGDVNVSGTASEPSSIKVRGGGVFDIKAGGYSWGDVGSAFRVTNDGLVTRTTAGVAQLGGDYLSTGQTHLKAGTLDHLGEVKQTAGQYLLEQGTRARAMHSGGGVQIHGGGIEGGGTVEGNLNLGIDPGAGNPGGSEYVYIHPRVDMGGTITVTGGLQMFSANAATYIDVLGTNSFSKIAVQGVQCVLNGRLNVTKDAAYKPDLGTELPIITAQSIDRNFTSVSISNNLWFITPDPITPGRMFEGEKQPTRYILKVIRPPVDPNPGMD